MRPDTETKHGRAEGDGIVFRPQERLSLFVSQCSPVVSNRRRYCLITPCRDEAVFAARTIESVLKQTAVPARWVIVDDGSRDNTADIAAAYAVRHPWIQVVRREDRGNRKVGGGVIDA